MTYKNGFAIPKHGAMPGMSQADIDELANLQPTLTYGKAKPEPPQDFVPAHVAFDKKVSAVAGNAVLMWFLNVAVVRQC